MNEIFIEQLIKRKTSTLGVVLRTISCMVLAVLALFMFMVFVVAGFYGMYVFFMIVLFTYISYKIWQYTDIEYEYSILNGEITIDRIKGQIKRKNVEIFDLKNTEIVAPLNSEKLNEFKNRNIPVRDFSSWDKKHKKYVAITQGKKGVSKIVFEPNEAMLNAMKTVKPVGVYMD